MCLFVVPDNILTRVAIYSVMLSIFVNLNTCWQHFRRTEDTVPNTEMIEHFLGNISFGMCENREKFFSFNVTEPISRVKGNLVLRGWLNVNKTPHCVVLQPEAYDNAIEYNTPLFQITLCIVRVSYCHSLDYFYYYYYEWYYPAEWTPTSWNLTFYYKNESEFPKKGRRALTFDYDNEIGSDDNLLSFPELPNYDNMAPF